MEWIRQIELPLLRVRWSGVRGGEVEWIRQIELPLLRVRWSGVICG